MYGEEKVSRWSKPTRHPRVWIVWNKKKKKAAFIYKDQYDEDSDEYASWQEAVAAFKSAKPYYCGG